MADGGAGSSENTNQANDSYFSTFTARFAVWHQAWSGEDHRPHTVAEYEESLKTDQTSICASLAALEYQKDKLQRVCEIESYMQGVVLEKVVGVDSHMFHYKWVSPDDVRLCFHVNFYASVVGGRKKSNFFFSEVVGGNCPQAVNSCVLLETPDSSVKNCKFCTGLWHPVKGSFLGHKNLPPPSIPTMAEPPAKRIKHSP